MTCVALLMFLLAGDAAAPLGPCANVLSYVAGPSDELIISDWRPAEPTCQRGDVELIVYNRSTKTVTGATFLVARDQTCSKAAAYAADVGTSLPKGVVLAPGQSTTLNLSRWLLRSSRADAKRCKRPGASVSLSEVTFSDGTKQPPDRIGPALKERCEGKKGWECARLFRREKAQ
jgi:hypothetical protein